MRPTRSERSRSGANFDQLGADWEHGLDQEEILRRYAASQGAGRTQGPQGSDFSAGDASDFFEQFFGFGESPFNARRTETDIQSAPIPAPSRAARRMT